MLPISDIGYYMRTIRIRYILKTISFIIFITPSIFSQGQYLDKGSTGIGIGANYQSNNIAKGFASSVGFSYKGVVDIGLAFGKFSIKQIPLYEYTAYSSAAYVSIYAVKNDNAPFILALNGSLQYDSYSEQPSFLSSYQKSYSFGSIFIKNDQISPVTSFQLFAGWTFMNILNINEEKHLVYHLGFSIFRKISIKQAFVIDTSVSFFNDLTTVSVGLGYIFIFKKTNNKDKL